MWLSATFTLLLLLAPSKASPNTSFKSADKPQRAKNRIIVKFKAQAGAHPLDGVQSVQLSAGDDVDLRVKHYKNRPDVEWAEPDYLLQADATPNDPQFSSQWHLGKVGAPAAWDATTGSSVPVCVVDSGVDYNHPDIAPNMNSPRGWNYVAGNDQPLDDFGHGTHVAGILGAAGNNGGGVTGVNWKLRIIACKFMGSTGSGLTSNAVLCLRYCADNGARVISGSFSGGGYSQALADAINYAASKDVLFVSSAGNSAANIDTTPNYPPSYKLPNQLVVAASDYSDNPSYYTNWGTGTVHLAAPGDDVLSTVMGGGTDYKTGTSMATPIVSGAAALLLAADGSLSYAQLRQKLLAAVVPSAGLAGKVSTGGRLDLAALLAPYKPVPSPSPSPSPRPSPSPSPSPSPKGKKPRRLLQQL